jgi:hypothetical protein
MRQGDLDSFTDGDDDFPMRYAITLLVILALVGCRGTELITPPTAPTTGAHEASPEVFRFPAIVAPLIDPAKLDTLKGKRAATPRLRKACYWLEMASRDGHDAGIVIDQAHALTGPHKPERMKAQRESLLRNLSILERQGCLDEGGKILTA